MKFTWGNRSRSRWTCDFGTRQNSTGQTVNMRMFMPSKIKEMAGTTLDTDIDRSAKDDLSKLYHVIILNDDDHTFEYVIEMLQAIFGLPYATALAHTMEADSTGSSIVLTTNLEEAEHKRDQIHAYGPDWRLPHSRGSVAALVERAKEIGEGTQEAQREAQKARKRVLLCLFVILVVPFCGSFPFSLLS